MAELRAAAASLLHGARTHSVGPKGCKGKWTSKSRSPMEAVEFSMTRKLWSSTSSTPSEFRVASSIRTE